MNKNKSLILGGIFLLLLISILISFMFCNTGISIYKAQYYQNKTDIKKLTYKIDSLETVINTSFKSKKDTITINVIPQEIKIYNK